ncbi:hypothetical protein ACQY0O_001048 [Thecaphora frezii]
MMPSFFYHTTPQAFVKLDSPSTLRSRQAPTVIVAPPPSSQTTLSQRFRRAIKQGDLELAKRVAAKALELQQHHRSSAYKAFDPVGFASPHPPKAALRAANAQRPSSTQPFDVRNVQHTDLEAKRAKLPNRSYSLGANYPDPPNDDAESSLVLAIKHHADIELIRWLIDMGHEQKGVSSDMYGHNVLHLAALYDRADVVYAYSTYSSVYVSVPIAELAGATSLHDRRTALHLACIKGHEDVARQLLDVGAPIDLADREGNTALHCASAWGHLSLVQLLIERGCVFAAQNHEGFTAADFAFTHNVKAALEAFGREQFESRKRTRRGQAAASPFAATSGSAGPAFRRSLDDQTYAGRYAAKPRTEFKPPPLPLGIDAAGKGLSSPKPRPPHSATFAPFNGQGRGSDPDPGASPPDNSLYGEWNPESTFARPGQDLFAGGRYGVASPGTRQVAIPSGLPGRVRPSLDLYSEYMAQSALRREARGPSPELKDGTAGGEAKAPVPAVASKGRMQHPSASRPSLNEERQRAPASESRRGRRSPLPPSQSDGPLRAPLSSKAAQLARRTSLEIGPSDGIDGDGAMVDARRSKDTSTFVMLRCQARTAPYIGSELTSGKAPAASLPHEPGHLSSSLPIAAVLGGSEVQAPAPREEAANAKADPLQQLQWIDAPISGGRRQRSHATSSPKSGNTSQTSSNKTATLSRRNSIEKKLVEQLKVLL